MLIDAFSKNVTYYLFSIIRNALFKTSKKVNKKTFPETINLEFQQKKEGFFSLKIKALLWLYYIFYA